MAWITEYQRWLSESESLNNAQMVLNHFGNTDWSKEALAAMCGNMRHESSLNPDMYEYGYDWADDRGFGLVQWTPRSKYWDWAVGQGLSPRLGDSQLARIDYEVENNIQWIPRSDYESMTFSEFRQNSGGWTVAYLTEAFTWSYERPNEAAGWDSMPARKAFAARVFTELDFTGTGSKPAFPTVAGSPRTDPYGPRIHPITGEPDFHAGTDWANINGDTNQPIYATQSGVVIDRGFHEVMGNYVTIQHTGDTYYSRYIHLRDVPLVAISEEVTKGQTIAVMGTTGGSTGIHLHFSISPDGSSFSTEAGTIDPEIYLEMTFGGGGGTPPPSKGNATTKTQYKYEKTGVWEKMTYYKVKAGDSLSEIANRHGVSMKVIQQVEYKNIPNKNKISVGQILILPTYKKEPTKASPAKSKIHIVKAGENLSTIAQRYNVSYISLANKNGIKDPDLIQIGQRLKI